MDPSIFLAKFYGLLLIIIGVSAMTKYSTFTHIIKKLKEDSHSLYLGGFIKVILGLLLILFHNIWTASWEVVITILNWLIFLKGLSVVLLPPKTITKTIKTFENKSWCIWGGFILVIVGVYLIIQGYNASII